MPCGADGADVPPHRRRRSRRGAPAKRCVRAAEPAIALRRAHARRSLDRLPLPRLPVSCRLGPNMENHRYSIVLEPDPDEGGYTVTVPALPGVATQGATVDEAIEMA